MSPVAERGGSEEARLHFRKSWPRLSDDDVFHCQSFPRVVCLRPLPGILPGTLPGCNQVLRPRALRSPRTILSLSRRSPGLVMKTLLSLLLSLTTVRSPYHSGLRGGGDDDAIVSSE